MNETEQYLQELKKVKQSLNSESDTFNNDQLHISHIIYEDNYGNKLTDEEVSEQEIGADDGAKDRQQYFQFAHQQLKAVEDDSVCSFWDSEYPTNRNAITKGIHPQKSQEGVNSLAGSKKFNGKVLSINTNNNNINNNNNNNGDIKINMNTLTFSQGSDKANQKMHSLRNKETMKQYQIPDDTNGNMNSQMNQITNQEVILTNLQTKNNQNYTCHLNDVKNDAKNISIDIEVAGDALKNNQESGLTGVWKHSSLLIITLVKKFQNMLMSHNNQNKFRALDKRHFQVIGDKSVYSQYYSKYKQEQDQMYFRKMKTQGNNLKSKRTSQIGMQYYRQISTNQIQQQQNDTNRCNWIFFLLLILLKNVKVIQPNSKFKIAWNILIFLITILNFFLIPLKVSFASFQINAISLSTLTYMSGFFFVLDTVMNFNSAYFSKGLIITDRKKIIKNYMKKNFFIDLFTLLAFAFCQFSYHQIEAGVLIKVLKLAPLMENFEEILNLRQRGQAILSLAKLIFFVVMVTHILGCTFFLFARFEEAFYPEKLNWIDKQQSWDKDWYDQYIISLYWSVVTMITVGYGDITPVNTIERIFCIIIMLISCGVFAYSINQIGRILEELSKKDAIFRDNISLVTSYLKQRGISYDLQLRIRKYFQYLHKENLEDNEKSEGLMDLLPSSLKNQLGREMYAKIINEQKVFRLNFSQKFILELSLKMKEKRLGPEELIFQERDYLDRLYFLIKGQVELFVNVRDSDNNNSTSVNIINKGRLLGQNAFFTQLPCSTGARCINVTSLIYIGREDFLDTIKRYHKDYEKFCMLRDNLQINHISRGLGTKCHLCGSFNHAFQTCHLVRYTPMKEKVILRYNKLEQGRDPQFVRNDRRCPTSSARIAYEYLKDTAINFLLDFNPGDTDEETVLEVVEKLRKYYASEEQKWKQPKVICKYDDHIEEEQIPSNNNIQSQSPTNQYQHDPYSVLNSENVFRQQSLHLIQSESNPVQPSVPSRKKKKTLSFLQVDDCTSDSNYKPTQITNIINSPLRRKRPKDATNNSDTFNTITLQNATQNSSSQYQQSNQVEQKDMNQINNQNQFTIGGFINQRHYTKFKTTSSRPERGGQDDSQAGNNSELLSSNNQPQNNLLKSTRIMTRRRNNILSGGVEDAELLKKNSFSDLIDLDRFMIFELYFIDGNINKILEHYNNCFIHLKNKDEVDTLTKKRNQFKRLITKKKLTKSERSMNILKNKIIQKRSQSGKHGTYLSQYQGESPLTSLYQTVKSGKTQLFFKNPIQESFGADSSLKNNSNKNANSQNQSVAFNDCIRRNEIIKQSINSGTNNLSN